MKKQIDTPVANLILDNDVLFVKMKAGIEFDEATLEGLFIASNQLVEFKKRHVIVDTRKSFNSSPEVRNLYATDKYINYRYSDSFIVNSLPMRLLVNFYISFHKPKIPTKMFNNEKKAIEWINSLKKEMGANF
jgi:hypothetical protein